MKLFVITTMSESSDHYSYTVKHPTVPTKEELKAFLIEHSCDKLEEDDGTGELFEHIEDVVEISAENAKLIPKVSAATLKKWHTCGSDE